VSSAEEVDRMIAEGVLVQASADESALSPVRRA
jgi:hypothetical protein